MGCRHERLTVRFCFKLWLCALAMLILQVASPLSASSDTSLRGFITSLWADPTEPGQQAKKLLFLRTETSRTVPLGTERDWREQGLQEGELVTISEGGTVKRIQDNVLGQRSISRRSSTGVVRWISLLCKFSDRPEEINPPASFYSNMYEPGRDRLPDIWSDQSYGKLNIEGRGAVGWLNLPHPRDYYFPPGESVRIGALGDDCIEAGDPHVDFSQLEGMNLFFSDHLDGYAYGGLHGITRDGLQNATIGVTFLNPTQDLGTIAHEMGHALGLLHSNNSDQDTDPYDNSWDVMSKSGGFSRSQPTYGSVGIHTNAYYKDLLGWISADERFDYFCGEQQIVIAALAQSEATGYRLGRIHLPGQARFYNLEVRGSGYYEAGISQAGILGKRLIIYEVEPTRQEPAWVLDKRQPPSDQAAETAAWSVGEVWHDPSRALSVRVTGETPDGLAIKITRHPCDGNRFRIDVDWKDSQGNTGTASEVRFGAGESKVFWFFSPENWEMMVKVLDGCALNGHYWIFAAATTNVEYTLRVTDTGTGNSKIYFKGLGPPAPAITDTAAFQSCDATVAASNTFSKAVKTSGELVIWEYADKFPGPCAPTAHTMCMENGRFEVRAQATDFSDNLYRGRWVPLWTDNSGIFWFFGPENWEILVKVLNGCSLNGKFWVFLAATTTVDYTLTVRDSVTGIIRVYYNPRGQVSPAATDTSAFSGCPS